jgi:phospholipid/cholesterol/gamma-HCH transport system substrate-binding protein
LKISNETKVGILATFALVILILGYNFLRGNDLFTSEKKLSSKYTEINGLNKGNPVLLYGLTVGRIDDLQLINESYNKVLVKYHINGDVSLPINSVAKIISSDILGSKAIDLLPGDATTFVGKHDTLRGDVEVSLSKSISKVVAPFQEKLENLLGSVDTVVTGLNEIFNGQTKRDLKLSFLSIRETVKNIEHVTGQVDSFTKSETGRIRSILVDFQSISYNIKTNNAAITRAINNFAAITDSLRASRLKQTLLEANVAVTQVNQILTKIHEGKGSMGLLLNDEKLYNNLDAASKDMDLLVKDLKQNPKRYIHFSVFGGKDKKLKVVLDTSKAGK